MFITQDEMNRRLNSQKNLANTFRSEDGTGRRSVPKPVVEKIKDEPPTIKQPVEKPLHIVAGVLAAQGVPVAEISKEFNVPIKDIKNPDAAVKEVVLKTTEKIRDMAIEKMMISLGLMTPDKFVDSNLKDLSTVAANLSKVIQNTAPVDNNANQGARIIIYAPQAKDEKSYTVIDV